MNANLKPRFLSTHRSTTIQKDSQVFSMADHALQIEPSSPRTNWLYRLRARSLTPNAPKQSTFAP